MVHPYLRRRQGLEPVTYLHPSLEPALRETLGVIIFQEQVIRVAMALAGFTPGEADLLRRAMSRSRSSEAMLVLRSRFLAGAGANGVEPAVAEEVFTQLQGFRHLRFLQKPRRQLRAHRLPDPLAQGPPSGRILLRAAEPPADGVLLARGGHRGRQAARHHGAAAGRQRERGWLHAGAGERRRHGDTETRRHGDANDAETRRHGDTETGDSTESVLSVRSPHLPYLPLSGSSSRSALPGRAG